MRTAPVRRVARQLRPLVCIVMISTPIVANAQSMALEEVVVTAQKRTESLQDTPISIAAFNAGTLEAKGITNLVDLQANVPNFQIAPTPSSASSIRAFMRGVGNNDDQITQDPSSLSDLPNQQQDGIIKTRQVMTGTQRWAIL